LQPFSNNWYRPLVEDIAVSLYRNPELGLVIGICFSCGGSMPERVGVFKVKPARIGPGKVCCAGRPWLGLCAGTQER